MRKAVLSLSLMVSMILGFAQDRITGEPFATRSEVIAQHGMACTSQPLATQVALDVLKAGGNAIDAAIAANAVLGLVEPTGNGMGGDLFAIVWDAKTEQLYGLNASGRSPKSLTREYFIENGHTKIPAYGPLPVSVPGCVDGWFALHGRFGSKEMKEILQPAIGYARDGFPVTELIAYYWAGGARALSRFPNVADVYMPGGNAPAKGEIFKKPSLANTLEVSTISAATSHLGFLRAWDEPGNICNLRLRLPRYSRPSSNWAILLNKPLNRATCTPW